MQASPADTRHCPILTHSHRDRILRSTHGVLFPGYCARLTLFSGCTHRTIHDNTYVVLMCPLQHIECARANRGIRRPIAAYIVLMCPHSHMLSRLVYAVITAIAACIVRCIFNAVITVYTRRDSMCQSKHASCAVSSSPHLTVNTCLLR